MADHHRDALLVIGGLIHKEREAGHIRIGLRRLEPNTLALHCQEDRIALLERNKVVVLDVRMAGGRQGAVEVSCCKGCLPSILSN